MSKETVVVAPGDVLSTGKINLQGGDRVKIGNGLQVVNDTAIVTMPGVLQFRKPANFWVETSRKKYYPKVGDQVVGIVEDRGGDFYTINIFSGTPCILNRLAFDGATKRNKPELKRGDAIYARVISAGGLEGDVELSCASATTTTKKDWSSGETIYCGLQPGLVLTVSSSAAQRLLRPDCAVLTALGKYFAFEIAVGVNGVVWIRNSASPTELIIVRSALRDSEHLDDAEVSALVDKLARRLT